MPQLILCQKRRLKRKSKMKKAIAWILVIALVVTSAAFIFTSCGNDGKKLSENVENDIKTYSDDLKAKMSTADSVDDFADLLYDYCDAQGFDVKKVTGKNIVITTDKTANSTDTESKLFVLEFKNDADEGSCETIANALAIINNLEEHGEIKLVMTPYSENDDIGVSKLSSKYLNADKIYNLTYAGDIALFDSIAGSKKYIISDSITKQSVKGTLTYKIKISGLKAKDSGERSEEYINPIVYIGDFLSEIKSDSINVEIASFESTGSTYSYPNEATATIVIENTAKTDFTKEIEKKKTKFDKEKSEKNIDATLEISEVDTPRYAYSYDDTSSILALLQTLTDGVFATTKPDYEGDVLGISTIYSVSTKNGININSVGRYADDATKQEMDTTYAAIASLADFKLTQKEMKSIWSQGENAIVSDEAFNNALKDNGIKIDYISAFTDEPCTDISETTGDIPMVTIGTNADDGADLVVAFIKYLSGAY